MGKASRTKAQRRRNKADAHFEVFCPGVLEVLSIGKGDLKLTVDVGHPDDVAKAKALIEEMLRKGYAIFVETEAGPVRVKEFNPELMAYVIYEVPDPNDAYDNAYDAAKRAPRKRKARKRNVPVAGSKATAVGRTSGGQGPSPTAVGHFTIREPRNSLSVIPAVGDEASVAGFVLARLVEVRLCADDPDYADLTWEIEGDVVVGSMTTDLTLPSSGPHMPVQQ